MDTYKSWTSGLIKKEVEVHIPKFKFGYKEMLNDPLIEMGLGIAFTDFADFTGINPAGNLLISRVIHQSFIDVNEEGTEAAAATVVEVSLTSAGPEIPVFKADKPFIFLIREKSSNAILFMGKVGVPVYE
jgi:serpin B